MRIFSWLRGRNDGGHSNQSGGRGKTGPAPRCRPRLELLEDRLTPSTLTVTSPLDDGSSATLRSVIAAASNGDTINFDPSLSGSTINLDSSNGELFIGKDLDIIGLGAANLAVSGQHQARVFEIAADADVSISGLTVENGYALNTSYLYNAGGGGGIFNDGTLTMADCKLTGNSTAGYFYGGGGAVYSDASLTLTGCEFNGNYASTGIFGGGGAIYSIGALAVTGGTLSGNIGDRGGAIFSDNGTAALVDVHITGNTAYYLGGGIDNGNFGNGGGMTIQGGAITGNSALYSYYGSYGSGGGIENGGTLTIADCPVSDNYAVNVGGGISNDYSTLTIDGSVLSHNSAGVEGGGIANRGNLSISDSTISYNSAKSTGGGISNEYFGGITLSGSTLLGNTAGTQGGGIYSNHGDVLVEDSTITSNSAAAGGGGIYNSNYYSADTLTVRGSAISSNSARIGGGIYNSAILHVSDSQFSGNQASYGAGVYTGNYYGQPATATVTGTDFSGNGTALADNSGTEFGGAIMDDSGSLLTVSGGKFSGNSAYYGAGIGSYGTLTVDDATLCDNNAGWTGGAIYVAFASAQISDSTIAGNSAGISGGGISGGGTITNCTVNNNSSASGGGISGNWVIIGGVVSNNIATVDGGGIYGSPTVSGCTISGNSAGHDGGGICNGNFYNGSTLTVSGISLIDNSAGHDGGGIYTANGYYFGLSSVSITSSLLMGNSAAIAGGGIFNASGSVTISDHSNITLNSAGTEGGGIYNGGVGVNGLLHITDSTDCENLAPIGADLSNYGTWTHTNSCVCDVFLAGSTTYVYVYNPDTFDVGSSVLGELVVIQASIRPVGGATPTGTVVFMLDGVKLGVATLDSYGSAVLTTTYLPVGVHSITAIYSGDGNMTGSTSAPFTQTVLSAQQELLLIADQVNNMVQNDTLNSGVGQALISELDNAIAILNTGNTTAGINKLDALLNRTQALVRTGQLDGYDAEVLIEEIDLAIAAALATQS